LNNALVITRSSGASGLGQVLASTIAARGARVVVLDVNPIITKNGLLAHKLLYALASIPRQDRIKYYQCDVSRWEEVKMVSQRVEQEVGTRWKHPHFALD
jgi:NAD(P)-dependent dehydrogenase (short-subunit alcohol dehydrogenase family)